jgi:hypothetical protein
MLAGRFYQSLIQNTVSSVKNYIDDLGQISKTVQNRLVLIAQEIHSHGDNKWQDFLENNFFFPTITPKDNFESTKFSVYKMVNQFSEECTLSDSFPFIQDYDYGIKGLTKPVDHTAILDSNKSYDIREDLIEELKGNHLVSLFLQ